MRIVSIQTDKKYFVAEVAKTSGALSNSCEFGYIPPITAGNRVTIEYRAIDFKTHPEKRQYRCRIYESANHETRILANSATNTDTPYNPPTKEVSFDWTPKKPGDYLFEVQAIDRDLNYSEPAYISLKIIPPWYLNGLMLTMFPISIRQLQNQIYIPVASLSPQRDDATRQRLRLHARQTSDNSKNS